MNVQNQVARALLQTGAVGFTPHMPITFKSGIVSPVYVDNRRLPFAPDAWHVVIDGFRQVIEQESIEFDILAGIETGAIPHSAALGYVLQKPSVFVRKQAKEHGQKKAVEGGDVVGKTVLLIEDLVTTGGSSLAGVEALRDEGARVVCCLAIVSYGFEQAITAFVAADVQLFTLTSFDYIVQEGQASGHFSAQDVAIIDAWRQDPLHWSGKGLG
ncbi:MAG: orotate phosphoribosyltransferase [Burkholderiales bacterium]|nr:orotate phosphoribosyltransferase [Anaerolineae bacterium]